MRRKLTEGPMSESEMLVWAQNVRAEVDRHYFWHTKNDSSLSGAQTNFLIEMQRAADHYVRYCNAVRAGTIDILD